MPTLPSRPSPDEPHRARHVAESFGAEAERYDRTRPRYPGDLIARVVAASPGPDVLDVGCGTGIASRAFAAAGCRVLGVDPDGRMAAFARRHGLPVEVATFEDWDPAGRAFDAVVAGQSWHWVDTVAGAEKAASVLRPGGRFAPFWYVFEAPPALAEAFSAVYARVLPDSPFARGVMPGLTAYSAIFATTADGIRATGAFSEPEEWRFTWQRPYTRDEWLDQVPSFGGHADLPADTLDALLAGVGAAIDAVGGTFPVHYTAAVVTASRST